MRLQISLAYLQNCVMLYYTLSWKYIVWLFICELSIEGVHCSALDKVVYPGGRIFLPTTHYMRHDTAFRTTVENGSINQLRRTKENELKTAKYLDQLEIQKRDTKWVVNYRINWVSIKCTITWQRSIKYLEINVKYHWGWMA